MDSCAQFLAVAEHRLITSRARSIGHQLRKAGYQSVWSPACQDQVAGGHAGVGWLVWVGGALLSLPSFVTPQFQEFFRLGRVLRTTPPTGKGGAVHPFVVYGYQGAEDADQLQLTDKLLQAVLDEAQVVCVGQPLLIAGDLNADPAVIPCLANCISAGRFVDLALAYSMGAGRKLDATCFFWLDECAGSRMVVVLMRLQLLQLVGSQIGGSLFTSRSLQAFALTIGLLRSLAWLLLSRSGQLVGLTLLTGLPLLYLVQFLMPGIFIERHLVLCHRM